MHLWQVVSLAQVVAGHSWIDNIFVSTQPDVLGYPRNYAGHDAALTITQYKVLVNDLSPAACGPSQQGVSYSSQYPMLVAPAGSEITATYLENGHVTKDKLPPDNLPHPGNYSWFISSKGGSLVTFADLNSATLLSGPSPFDDGRCAVDAAGYQGRQGPIDCKSKITIPATLSPGTYQLVWWWNFLKLTAVDPSYTEWYTTCLDIQVTASGGGIVAAAQKAGTAALSIPKYANTTFTSTNTLAATPVIQQANVVAPKAVVAALANSKVAVPLQEQDVVVVSLSKSVVTSTYTYNHPTIIETTTTTTTTSSSTKIVPSSTSTVVASSYIPTSMQVNPIDGSLSPLIQFNNEKHDVKSSAAATISTSRVEEVVTVHVPVYITVEPTDCPATTPTLSPTTVTSAMTGVTTVTSVVQVTLTQTHTASPTIAKRDRRHPHNHHHQHRAY